MFVIIHFILLSSYSRSIWYWLVLGIKTLERATGIEPVSSAWKAVIIPLYQARFMLLFITFHFSVVNVFSTKT